MNYYLIFSTAASFLISAFYLFMLKRMDIKSVPGKYKESETNKINEISKIIINAAKNYIFAQIKILLLIQAILIGALCMFNFNLAIWFFVGSIVTYVTGAIAMYVSIKFNKKVALFAFDKGIAFEIAFSVGKIIAFSSISLILLTMYLCFILSSQKTIFFNFLGLTFGSSLTVLFARLGGGIFTKAADMAADLSGKINSNMKEDDPRNPAVIADMLGDSIGDAFGMCADLSETYIIITFAAISLFKASSFPLVFTILSLGLITSILTLLTGWKFNEKSKFSSLNISLKVIFIYVSLAIGAVFLNILPKNIIYFLISGAVFGAFLMPLTEIFTSASFWHVKSIVKASEKGDANNILQGLIVGYKAVSFNAILLIIHLFVNSFVFNGDIVGIMFSCLSMISIAPVILALDGFGPITDNAGGLVEIANLPYRETTDLLDVIGNKNKAATKGYAIYASSIAAIILSQIYKSNLNFDLTLFNIFVLFGVLIASFLISYFLSTTLSAVNNACMKLLEETTEQIKNITRTKCEPNYKKAIEIATTAALRGLFLPALVPIFLVNFIFHLFAFWNAMYAVSVLAGLIFGLIILGMFQAIQMTVAGAAWDNTKKEIESKGKKGTAVHKSAVTGDVVGDPLKDTAGPSVNPMTNTIIIMCIMLVKLFY